MLYEDDIVDHPGTTQQIFCKVSLKDNSRADLLNVLRYIHETLKVYNEKGENLVMNLW